MNPPNANANDYSFPNNDKKTATSSPLMNQVQNVWSLPWPRKVLSGKPKSPGKPGPKTSRSGVHKLGKQPKRKNY